MSNQFVGYENIVPLLAPQDIAATDTVCAYLDLRNAQKAAFLVHFGAVTSATATDDVTVTVEAATAEGGTEATIDFRYRLSGVVTANTWGAVTTAAAATGATIASDANDNMTLWIEIDPDELAASEYRFARVLLSTAADMTACLVGVVGVIQARYKQTTHISATASASA